MNAMIRNYRQSYVWLALVGIGCLALGLRLDDLGFGLPYVFHPDEPRYVAISQHIFKGDLNPHFFRYPSLFFYLNSAAYLPYYWVERLAGAMTSPADIVGPRMLTEGVGIVPIPSTFLLGRGVSTAFSVATVVLVFAIGRKISGRASVGLIAGLLYACSPTAVEHSHYITPDTIAAFFCTLCLYASLRVLQLGDGMSYAFAAVAGGLAASTKYNASIVLVLIPLAALLRDGRRAFKNPYLYAAPAIAVLAFLAATPFSLLEFKLFVSDMSKEAHHYSTGHSGMEGNAPAWYAKWIYGETGIGMLLIAWGALEGARSRSRPYLLLITFPIIYLIFISSFVVRNARTALPLVAGLSILEAWGLIEASVRLRASAFPRAIRAASLSGIVVYLVLVPSWAIAAVCRRVVPDSRDLGRVWIANNALPGAKLAIEPYSPYVDPKRYHVRAFQDLHKKPFAWYKGRFDYVVLTGGNLADDLRFTGIQPTKVFLGAGPQVRIYDFHAP